MDALNYLKKKATVFNGEAVLLGKGPSSSEWVPSQYKSSFVLGINQASLKEGVSCTFSIDTNNFRELKVSPSKPLISAYYPNVESNLGQLKIFKPGIENIFKYFDSDCYAFNLGENRNTNLTFTSQSGKFSSSIALELLCAAGFNKIILVGIDGGTKRSREYSGLVDKPLMTVHGSYSEQFADIKKISLKYPNVEISSFRSTKNTILIGAEAEQQLAEEVLKYSIDKTTFLKIHYVKPEINKESELFAQNGAGTPFSFQRFQMPELASNRGRGVYLDSDMQVFEDIYELFNRDMCGNNVLNCKATLGRREQYSVFLADLEQVSWSYEDIIGNYIAGIWNYDEIMKQFIFEDKKATLLENTWNSMEWYEPSITRNIHYTDMGVQPWLSIYNPRGDLWVRELFNAINASNLVANAFQNSLDKSWVRPSLRYQIEHQHFNPWTLPKKIRDLDREWIPPHLTAKFSGGMTNGQRLKWTLASHVRRLMQSRSYRRAQKVKSALKKIF